MNQPMLLHDFLSTVKELDRQTKSDDPVIRLGAAALLKDYLSKARPCDHMVTFCELPVIYCCVEPEFWVERKRESA